MVITNASGKTVIGIRNEHSARNADKCRLFDLYNSHFDGWLHKPDMFSDAGYLPVERLKNALVNENVVESAVIIVVRGVKINGPRL